MRRDRAVVLGAPDDKPGDRGINQQKSQPCGLGWRLPERQDGAEHAAGYRGGNADAETAERGGKKHRRKIQTEGQLRPDQRQAPARGGRHRETENRKAGAHKQRGLRDSSPALPEFVSPFCHLSHSADRHIENKADHRGKIRLAKANGSRRWAWLALPGASRDDAEPKTFIRRRTTWGGWTARSRSSPERPAASDCARRRS